jgi:DNA-3-methyladenine glycosylase I
MKTRCAWAGSAEPMVSYHDLEWGIPVHDDRLLFEFLILEGAQAGLSWETILKKRPAYQRAYRHFNPAVVGQFGEADCERLLGDVGIVRNRLKIHASIGNARAFLAVREEFGSFDAYLWSFVDGGAIQNSWRSLSEVPAKTEISDRLSKDLQKRGFKFVGSTICYAFMQAVGMVNDHVEECFRHSELYR